MMGNIVVIVYIDGVNDSNNSYASARFSTYAANPIGIYGISNRGSRMVLYVL